MKPTVNIRTFVRIILKLAHKPINRCFVITLFLCYICVRFIVPSSFHESLCVHLISVSLRTESLFTYSSIKNELFSVLP